MLDSGKYTRANFEVLQFLQKQLYCKNPETKNLEDAELVIYLKEKLNRPMRVWGMVKNVGEPGGGPFWPTTVTVLSLQILESSQIDMDDPEKKEMFEKVPISIRWIWFAPYVTIKDISSILKYVDKATGFISL